MFQTQVTNETKVWLMERELKRRHRRGCDVDCTCRPGKCRCNCKCPRCFAFGLRWIDPNSGGWKYRNAGRDRKAAERLVVKLEADLEAGTYRDLRRIEWASFVAEHVATKRPANATETRRTLNEFGEMMDVRDPSQVRFVTIEGYVRKLELRGNALPTILKKTRYLKHAFRQAVRRGYIGRNPMEGWIGGKPDRKAPRIASLDDEDKLLTAANDLYGFRWRVLIYIALRTGGRRSELFGLTWERVGFDTKLIHFANTKGRKDRKVPVKADVLALLLRLKAQTQDAGGPFVGMGGAFARRWAKVLAKAGIEPIRFHALRATFATRLIRAGVPLPTVQKLCGHAAIQTTLDYYNWTSDQDLRDGIDKLDRAAG